jgi:hypothetical protein
MIRQTRFAGLTIICLCLFSSSLAHSLASTTYYSSLKKWNYILYQVDNYNEASGLSYFTDTGQIFTVTSNRNSHALFEFQYIGGKGPSAYDPNKIQAYGNLFLGNLTRHNATMYEMASNLALSIYPWFPGFLTGVNWTRETQMAQNGSSILMGNLHVSNVAQSVFNISVPAIKFDFKQNNHFQNTTLVYALATGALLYAITVAGSYKLTITAQLRFRFWNSVHTSLNFTYSHVAWYSFGSFNRSEETKTRGS